MLTGIAFAGIFFIALAFALIRWPIVGLYAYVAVFYLHPPSRWWGEYLPDLRWALLAAGATLLATWMHPPKDATRPSWLATTPARIMLVYVVWFWILSFWALDPIQHQEAAILLSKYLLVFYLVYRLVDTPDKADGLMLMHMLGCLYLGYLGYTVGSGGRLNGVGGPGIDDSSTLGMQVATATMFASVALLRARSYYWLLMLVVIAFTLNGVVLTGSRGAFVAVLAGSVAIAILRPATVNRRFALYAAAGIVMFGMLASATFWDRMSTIKTVEADDPDAVEFSAATRIVLFKAQLQMAALHPFGSGFRGTEVMSKTMLDKIYLSNGGTGARSSHNTIMTVLVEQGIPGLLMLIALVAWVARATLMLRRHARESNDLQLAVQTAGLGSAAVVIFVAGQFADFAICEVQIWVIAALAALMQLHGVKLERRNTSARRLPDN